MSETARCNALRPAPPRPATRAPGLLFVRHGRRSRATSVARLGAVATRCAVAGALVLLGLAPSQAAAQGVDLDLAFDQTFTSAKGLASPTGIRAAIGVPRIVGPMGLQLGYRRVSQDARESTVCTLPVPQEGGEGDGCASATVRESNALSSAMLGVTVSSMMTPFLELTLGLDASVSWQEQRLELLDEAPDLPESMRHTELGPDKGFGISGEIRFPRSPFGLRPLLYARYELIGGGGCATGGVCWGTRHLASLGVGLSRRIP